MSSSKLNWQIFPAFLLGVGFFTSVVCFANHFGGGIRYNPGNNGYHYNNSDVGNYHPGNGWAAPAYVAPAYIVNNPDDSDCQSVQQCDSNGNCIQTQDCD